VGVEAQPEVLLEEVVGEGFHVAAAVAEEVSVQAEVLPLEDEVDSLEVMEAVDLAGEDEEEAIELPLRSDGMPFYSCLRRLSRSLCFVT
jgi:hypothetical protein